MNDGGFAPNYDAWKRAEPSPTEPDVADPIDEYERVVESLEADNTQLRAQVCMLQQLLAAAEAKHS